MEQESNTNVALYVSVYITKSMENKDLEGYRVYGYSNKTLNKPIVETFYTDKTTEEILREFEDCKINFTNSINL